MMTYYDIQHETLTSFTKRSCAINRRNHLVEIANNLWARIDQLDKPDASDMVQAQLDLLYDKHEWYQHQIDDLDDEIDALDHKIELLEKLSVFYR